jgi:hypothetical protein
MFLSKRVHEIMMLNVANIALAMAIGIVINQVMNAEPLFEHCRQGVLTDDHVVYSGQSWPLQLHIECNTADN